MRNKENFNNKEIITIFFALFSVGFSIYTYSQLVKIDKAQVVISQNEIKLTSAGPSCPNGENYPCDVIDPVLKNIGKAIAEDVRIELFGCFFDEQIIYGVNGLHCVKYWDTKLIGSLAPGETGNYGNVYIPHQNQNFARENFIGKQFALIFQLSYKDTLERDIQHSFSFLQYQIGRTRTIDNSSALSFIISEDLQKMCPWLKNDLERVKASKELIGYINTRCNNKHSKEEDGFQTFLQEISKSLDFKKFININF